MEVAQLPPKQIPYLTEDKHGLNLHGLTLKHILSYEDIPSPVYTPLNHNKKRHAICNNVLLPQVLRQYDGTTHTTRAA